MAFGPELVPNRPVYSVPVTIKGGPTTPEIKSLPKHKKNAEIGEKKTVYTSSILVEQEDAISFDDQEEVRSVFPFSLTLQTKSFRSPSWIGVMPSFAPRQLMPLGK